MASPTAAWSPSRPNPPTSIGPVAHDNRASPASAAQPHITAPSGPGTRRFRFGSEDRPDPDPPLGAGSMIGDRYQILRLLGEGGMGRVYEAQHVVLRRRVALKLLRRDTEVGAMHGEAGAEPESLARFRQEALAASRIGAPEIVEVVDFASQAIAGRQQTYMVMELLVGESLEDWMNRDARLDGALAILASLCDGLAAAHRADVIHRDIKPANVFLPAADPSLRSPPRVKILDFGIAKITANSEGFQTRQGSLLGTPYYLAPERVMGAELTGAADIYSVGVILYEMLTGVVPFVADSFMGILANHVHTAPLDPRQAAPDRPIPDDVAQLCLRLLDKNPRARPSAAEVAAELRRLLTNSSVLARVAIGPRAQGSVGVDTQVLAEQTRELARVESVGVGEVRRSGTQIGHVPAGEPTSSRSATATPRAAQPARSERTVVLALVGVFGVGLLVAAAWFGASWNEPAATEPTEPATEPAAIAEPSPNTEIVPPVPSNLSSGQPLVGPTAREFDDPVDAPERDPREDQPEPPRESTAKPKLKPKPAPAPTPEPTDAPKTKPVSDPPAPETDPGLPTIKDDVYD